MRTPADSLKSSWLASGISAMPKQQLSPAAVPSFGTGATGSFGNAIPSPSRTANAVKSAFGSFGGGFDKRVVGGPSGSSAPAFGTFGGSFGSKAEGMGAPDRAFGTGAFGSGSGNQLYGFGRRGYTPASEGDSLGFGQPGGMQMPGMGFQTGGQFIGTNLGGGHINAYAQFINQSAARNGIPANFLAAFILRESQASPRELGRYVYLADRGYNILSFSGMTDPAMRRVGMDPRQGIGNAAYQIEAAARLLRQIADNEAKGYGWQGVANVYYSGDPSGRTTPGDSWQYGSTSQYTRDVMSFWQQMEGRTGITADGTRVGDWGQFGQGGMTGAINTVTGGRQYPITQDFGPTPFALGAGSWMYGYARGLGVQGHPGIDIGTPAGTPIYSATGGTVVVVGSGYYRDVAGGIGEIRVKLDNGDEVIYGHMRGANVRPGMRVQPGQLIGTSGSMNGDHLHLEYRRFGANTSTGYQAVDPRTVLGGYVPGGPGGFGQQPMAPQRFGPNWWNVPFSQLGQIAAR